MHKSQPDFGVRFDVVTTAAGAVTTRMSFDANDDDDDRFVKNNHTHIRRVGRRENEKKTGMKRVNEEKRQMHL